MANGPRDRRTNLYLPNKKTFPGDEMTDVTDNWQALEEWAKIKWEPLVLDPVSTWTHWVGSGDPPAFAVDGFGFLHLKGVIETVMAGAAVLNAFATLPEGARPRTTDASQSVRYPAAFLYFNTVSGNYTPWPGIVEIHSGNCFINVDITAGTQIYASLEGTVSLGPI